MSTCDSIKFNTDRFEHCYTIPCGIRRVLWETRNGAPACGSFTINIEQACNSVSIFVNGRNVITKPQSISANPQEGDLSYSFTSGNLESVEVLCNDPDATEGSCKINFCLTVHYECC